MVEMVNYLITLKMRLPKCPFLSLRFLNLRQFFHIQRWFSSRRGWCTVPRTSLSNIVTHVNTSHCLCCSVVSFHVKHSLNWKTERVTAHVTLEWFCSLAVVLPLLVFLQVHWCAQFQSTHRAAVWFLGRVCLLVHVEASCTAELFAADCAQVRLLSCVQT